MGERVGAVGTLVGPLVLGAFVGFLVGFLVGDLLPIVVIVSAGCRLGTVLTGSASAIPVPLLKIEVRTGLLFTTFLAAFNHTSED